MAATKDARRHCNCHVAALQDSQNRCLVQVQCNTMSIQQVSFVIVREKDKSSICSDGLSRQHA